MLELTLLLAAAAVAHGLSRWIGAPPIPLMVFAGAALPATGVVSGPGTQEILVLALSVLLFTAGTSLELSPAGRQRDAALRIGIVQFLVLGALGLGAAFALGYAASEAFHLAVALAASSTLVGVRLLQQQRQLFEPYGRLVVGVLLLQDLVVVLALPVLIRAGAGPAALVGPIAGTLVLVAGAWLVRRSIASETFERLELDSETWLLVFLTVLFGFLGAASLLEVPPVTGAFLAGFSLARFPLSAVARGQLSSLTDFFSALFFTALGTWIVVPGIRELLHGVALAALVVLVTPPVVALAAEREGFTARAGILSGLLLAQTSEFSLVVALQGVASGVVQPETLTVVALVCVITMTLTPLLATDRTAWALVRRHPLRRPPEAAEVGSDHVLLLGCGSNGMAVLDLLFLEGVEVVVVDEDPRILTMLGGAGIPVVRGDAADSAVLEAAGIGRARVVVSTLRRVQDNEAALGGARGAPVLVRAFETEDEAWVRRRGGTPVSFAEATAEDFLAWLDERQPSDRVGAEAGQTAPRDDEPSPNRGPSYDRDP